MSSWSLWSRRKKAVKTKDYGKKSVVNATEDMVTASFPFTLPIPFYPRGASGVGRIDF